MFIKNWMKRIRNIQKVMYKRAEIIPLFVLVGTGVCVASGMFVHKMITSSQFQFDKKKRLCILKGE